MTVASVLQPEGAVPPPAGAPDTPGGPDPQTATFQAWLRDFTIRALAAGWPMISYRFSLRAFRSERRAAKYQMS